MSIIPAHYEEGCNKGLKQFGQFYVVKSIRKAANCHAFLSVTGNILINMGNRIERNVVNATHPPPPPGAPGAGGAGGRTLIRSVEGAAGRALFAAGQCFTVAPNTVNHLAARVRHPIARYVAAFTARHPRVAAVVRFPVNIVAALVRCPIAARVRRFVVDRVVRPTVDRVATRVRQAADRSTNNMIANWINALPFADRVGNLLNWVGNLLNRAGDSLNWTGNYFAATNAAPAATNAAPAANRIANWINALPFADWVGNLINRVGNYFAATNAEPAATNAGLATLAAYVVMLSGCVLS